MKKPNIVFIYADDWGWGDLGCYGHEKIKTPNLDKLARRGTLFTKFHVCSGVCSPSRAAAVTGRFPAELGVHGHFADDEFNQSRGMVNFLDPDVPTYMSLMKESGYRVGHFGKWHLGHSVEAPAPSAYGIHESKVNVGNGPQLDINGFVSNDVNFNPSSMNPRALSSQVIVDETIDFIQRHDEENGKENFLVNVWLNDPHATLDPDEQHMVPYADLMPQLDQHKYPGAMAIYYGVITEADRQIGRLINTLEEMGLREETIIIFSSDNGPESIEVFNASHSGVGRPGPFRGLKRSLYGGGTRTPFIISWPGVVPENKINDSTVVSAVDLLPTFCDMARISLSPAISQCGETMTDVFLGSTRQRNTALFWEWRYDTFGHVLNISPRLAVLQGSWKLLFNPPDGTAERNGERIELYNIHEDLMEINNVAKDYPEKVDELKTMALEWLKTLPSGTVYEKAGDNLYPYPGR